MKLPISTKTYQIGILILILLLIVSCSPSVKSPPPQPQNPSVGGGCGVEGLPPTNMDESSCRVTKDGMHCVAKADF